MNRENAPYHLTDRDDFPMSHYLYDITKEPINIYYRIQQYCVVKDELELFLNKYGFKQVYSYNWRTEHSKGENREYATIDKENNSALGLVINPYTSQSSKRKRTKDIMYDWNEEDDTSNIYFYGSNFDYKKFEQIKEEFEKIIKKQAFKENNINLIVQTRHGYDTQTFDLPKQKLELEMNYGDEFLTIHDKIINELNKKNGKGLVLLHGEPGTGKTHYLKYLASKIKNKKVMFVPPHLVDFITSPEMTPFLIDNSDSILFIEDAERVITDRDQSSNAGVSNILNLTDGILGDILNIQIVATFNMDKRKIDTALLRKGRLIAEKHFDALKVDDANRLIQHLGLDHITNEPMTLTQIYNLQEIEYKSEDKQKKIGF